MGRKMSYAGGSLYSSASNKRIAVFVGVGFLIGLVLGFVAMGTLHAFLEIGATRHHDHELPGTDGGAAAAAREAAAAQAAAGGAGQQQVVRQQGGAAAGREQRQEQQQKKTQPQAAQEQQQQQQQPQQKAGGWPTTGDTIHTLFTSNGSPYMNFQTRIMVASYKLVQQMPGGDKLVGITRILHRTKPDVLMDEVPTFRANPLTPKCDDWCEYPVSDRPNAVRQFLDAARQDPTMIKAPWVYMIETDYVWMKPLAAPGRAEDPAARALAFPFGYIQPTHPNAAVVMRKMYPESRGPLSDIPNSGPAPVLMRMDDWVKVAPKWEELAAQIERDPQAVGALGWVREMYAFSLACAVEGVKLDLTPPPNSRLIVQPPADRTFGQASQAHYTWGSVFKDEAGRDVWQFDKRTYTAKEVETKTPYITEPPALQPGWKLQDGVPVDADLHATLLAMIRQMNRGVATLKDIQ